MPVLRDILAGAGALLALAPALASAGNGDLPRTPVIHQGEACMTVVDRSVDPVVHLAYTVPINDLCVTADELPDSRTHQFVAFCRDEPPAYVIPHWLARADVQRSADAGLLAAEVPASDVLEDSPRHDGCWLRITPDDARREISCEVARAGVDWDTTAIPAGMYVVAGYTWAPPLNMWSSRRGAFRVVDGDPDAAPPAVAVMNRETFLWKHQPVQLELCAAAMDGALLSADWALSTADPAWTAFVTDEPVEPGALTLELLPPPEAAGKRLAVRVTLSDPLGRVAVAHMPGELVVQTIADPSCETGCDETTGAPADDTGDDPFDFCADSPLADDPPNCPEASSSSGGESSGGAESGAEPEPDGCACATGHVRGDSSLLAALLLLARRRRLSGGR